MFGCFNGVGKVVSIVGAGSPDNMGQVMARRFAETGAKVVVSGRRIDVLQQLAQEINGDYVECDLCDRSAISEMVSAIVERHGKIDVAINATGWGLLTPFCDTTEEELNRMVDLQFKGPYVWLQRLVEVMSAGVWQHYPNFISDRKNHARQSCGLYGNQGRHRSRCPNSCQRIWRRRYSSKHHLAGANRNTHDRRGHAKSCVSGRVPP